MTNRVIPWALLLGVVAACARITVSQETAPGTDFAVLKTYAWHEAQTRQSIDPRLDPARLDAQIRVEIESALGENGFEKASSPASADFLVAYRTSVKTRSSPTAVNEPAGYSTGWNAHREDQGYRSVDSGGVYFEEWEQGRLIVDLFTPDGEQLFWRGTAKTEIHFDNPPAERARRLRRAVRRLIGQIRQSE
jgi:hypothetical protein